MDPSQEPAESRWKGKIAILATLDTKGEEVAYMAVLIPMRGWSIYGAPGAPLHDAIGHRGFLKALKDRLIANILFREVDAHINETLFVEACVKQLVAFMKGREN
ncbi:MAG: Tm-1-like ATP-binding domain-containing protein [Syntrophaceae bacterium]|nr:Tm-1-like ATP-binding domain-containing protein [Syntrophaceae bacterium]